MTSRSARPSIPPMPIEPVVDHPMMATANILVRGAAWSLVAAWWRGGCHSLPSADVDRMTLAGCDSRRWSGIRESVNRVVADVQMRLAGVYALELEKRVNRKRAASIAARVKNAMPRTRHAPVNAVPASVSTAGAPYPGTQGPVSPYAVSETRKGGGTVPPPRRGQNSQLDHFDRFDLDRVPGQPPRLDQTVKQVPRLPGAVTEMRRKR